jgi:hypothetical protein
LNLRKTAQGQKRARGRGVEDVLLAVDPSHKLPGSGRMDRLARVFLRASN